MLENRFRDKDSTPNGTPASFKQGWQVAASALIQGSAEVNILAPFVLLDEPITETRNPVRRIEPAKVLVFRRLLQALLYLATKILPELPSHPDAIKIMLRSQRELDCFP